MGGADKPLQHSNLVPPHRSSTVVILGMSWGLFAAEISSLYVKPLPYLELSNPVLLCCLLWIYEWPQAHSLWDSSIPLLLCSATTCSDCYLPFLPCTPGQVGDLVELTGSTEKRIQISCLSLSGSICYSSAAFLIYPALCLVRSTSGCISFSRC